jgi:uncharacterized repeat protein (TIGR02543 family)
MPSDTTKPGGTDPGTTDPTKYTVTFYAVGGIFSSASGTANSASATVESGKTAGELPVPTREGYAFGGWHTEPNGGGTPFTAETVVAADITVYAQWTAVVTVTGVTVSPSTATVSRGQSQSFAATVQGTNYPAQTVVWSVEGGAEGTATTITGEGVLTVGAGETASSLTVRAASTHDPAKSGTAAVTVPQPGQGTVTLVYPEDAAAGAFSDTAISLSKSGNTEQTLTVSGEYDTCRWLVDGTIKATRASITLNPADYLAGTHQISVEVARNGAAYSKAGFFTVEE